MSPSSQARAVRNYRDRLSRKGLARFEVLAPDADKDLIKRLAKGLAEGEAEACRLRDALGAALAGGARSRGGIYAALRRSPLVGADLDFRRERGEGRKVKL